MNKISQRDAFWNRIYQMAREDRDIVIVSADMGAPALDQIRRDLPGQFVNVGIAEQNGMLVAAGLALEGKRPYFYAIAPFAVFRPLEQIRVQQAIMNIPVTIVGVGAGFSYEDSGPTHHTLEDMAMMRAMPNITIHSVTDAVVAEAVARQSRLWPTTNYVRLDREVMPDIYTKEPNFADGYAVLRPGKEAWLLATGRMTHQAMLVADLLNSRGIAVGVIDVFQIPCNERNLVQTVRESTTLFSLEEHFLPGGFGSYLLEVLNKQSLPLPLHRLGLSSNYSYVYGGRERIHETYGLSTKQLAETLLRKLAP